MTTSLQDRRASNRGDSHADTIVALLILCMIVGVAASPLINLYRSVFYRYESAAKDSDDMSLSCYREFHFIGPDQEVCQKARPTMAPIE